MSQFALAKQALLAIAQGLLNKVLQLDKQKQWQQFAEKSIAIEISNWQQCVVLHFTETQVVLGTDKSVAHCVIMASTQGLSKLQQQASITQLIKLGELDVAGDIKLAQRLANYVEQLDLDWQSEIARHIGDLATFKLQQVGKKFTAMVKFARKQIQADASEYLLHEQKMLPTTTELSIFSESIKALAEQTSRLEQKLSKLTHVTLT